MKVSVNKILPFILLIVKYPLIFVSNRLYEHNLLNICGIIIFTESVLIEIGFTLSLPLLSQIVVGDPLHGMVNDLFPCPDRDQVDEDLSKPVVGSLAFGLVCKTIPFLLPIHNGIL
jgi:hypothetical protein